MTRSKLPDNELMLTQHSLESIVSPHPQAENMLKTTERSFAASEPGRLMQTIVFTILLTK